MSLHLGSLEAPRVARPKAVELERIKVAAEVLTRARRVVVRLSGSWPHRDHFLHVSRAVSGPPVPALTG